MNKCLLWFSVLLGIYKAARAASDTYSAVVVEYSPPLDASVDGVTNTLNNVNAYVKIINEAKSQFSADIIVFPEGGLQGVGNQPYYVEVPDPKDQIIVCASNTSYDISLVQLSCAALFVRAYVIVNLSEKHFNKSQDRAVYFNTDVVFDPNGAVVARYRKIHLFDEGIKEPSPNSELVYFDTEFGVRFGIFTCFDIIFEDPGVVLANHFNISHFVFLSGWMSQLPFLVATQEQHYWAYTQDVVLLAAGHNLPSIGGSGTGVYLGRHGPLVYRMVESRQSFMLHADVPKNYSSSAHTRENPRKPKGGNQNIVEFEGFSAKEMDMERNKISQEKIKLKHEDFLEIYASRLINIPKFKTEATDIAIPVILEEEICQNSLCCHFSINATAIFNNPNVTSEKISRGDDYSQLYYRLAVFDGVRHYDHIATGGLQTCAIISCINQKISSCGLRSDDPSAQINTINNYWQSQFIFESISIVGNFSNNRSFVGPNVLLGGVEDSYGSLLPSDSFIFHDVHSKATTDSVVKSFQTSSRIEKLVTASVYGRMFLRDGLPSSEQTSQQSSSNFDLINIALLITAAMMIKYSH